VSFREPSAIRVALARLVLIALGAAPTLALAIPGAAAAPQHEDAGAPRLEESPAALEVTTVIQCACGGCVNQTLHDCTCGYAAAERQRIEQALEAGRTPEAIIASYVEQHGPQIRIVPEKTGLNLIGWAVPFVAAAAGLLALTGLLLAWRRRTAEDPSGGDPLPSAVEDRYRDRLDRELQEID